MGLFDRLANILGLRKKEVNVLVVGLNNSGKSTVINHFKREDDRCIDIVPTVAFNVEKFACKLHNKQSGPRLVLDYGKPIYFYFFKMKSQHQGY